MPKIVDVEQRRAEIAHACWRAIAANGIAHLTTRQLAREAGIGTGVLFHYFRNKEDVIDVAFELLQENARAELRAAVGPATNSLERVRAAGYTNLPLTADRRVEFGVWLSLWAHSFSSPGLADRQRALYEGWRELLTSMIDDAIDDGLVDPGVDPAVCAVQLSGLTDGLVVQLMLADEDDELTRRCVAAVDALIDGWTHPSGSPSAPPRHRHAR